MAGNAHLGVTWVHSYVSRDNTVAFDIYDARVVPAGVIFELRAEHREADAVLCTGTARLRIAGGPLDGPLVWISLALTALLGVLLALAGRSTSPGTGQLVIGALLGLLFGWFLGLTVVLFAVAALSSPLPVIAAVLGLAGGAAWGRTAPLKPGTRAG